MTREALTSQAAVERLADAVVHGFAWPAKVELHVIPVRPVVERRRGKLGAIVTLQDRWETAFPHPSVTQLSPNTQMRPRPNS